MKRRIAAFLMLAGLSSVAIGILGSITTAASAGGNEGCDTPSYDVKNFGVIDCPTTTTTYEQKETTTTVEETTTVPKETTTVPEVTTVPKATTVPTTAAEATTTTTMTPIPPPRPELPRTGSSTWKFAIAGGVLCLAGAGLIAKNWGKVLS